MILLTILGDINWWMGSSYLLPKVIFGDGLVFTLFHRLLVGKWWWVDVFKKKKKKHWEFKIDETGWQLSGTGHNPFKTFEKIWQDMFHKQKKSLSDELRDGVRNSVRNEVMSRARNQMQSRFNQTMVDSNGTAVNPIDMYVNNIISDTLRREFGNKGKTKVNIRRPKKGKNVKR
jgi:hypothetical protein